MKYLRGMEQGRNVRWIELEEFQQLQGNLAAFKIMCDLYLPMAVGNRKFQMGKSVQLLSELVTVSEEAFVLLTLENNWEL